ncbi:blue (type 1) copper domain protein [Haloterrigena turkmenica DSM 5511]|uniref:Blue (Type 1) copper domain protein n=1 Tax=Haloterrigena turkmenica (strain ATCC 51198 / DSM 5511 / JCM 9101 / NCIMB 13204 / VKM B-1734 / 4k) TaxID=543526 RepID=D2RTB9_HALTV|nr:blue (type 1) copper domain protein [Haloterrigena turkmenica DSM 5511]
MVAGCGGGSGNGDENGNGNGSSDGYEIEPDTTVELEAATTEWTGIAPSDIEGESNPTLILQAGETYEIGWTQGDGSGHNIEIRDDSGEVVNDLATEQTDEEEPSDQMLEFTASSEMTEYVCKPHSSNMVGELQVEGSNGGGNGNESEGNESGNESEGNMSEGNESGNESEE